MRVMKKITVKNGVTSLFQSEKGATAIEYGLIISFIVIAMVVALQGVADSTIGMWNNVSDAVVNNN